MNKEWSELNKTMQSQLKKKETFEQGKETLFRLRDEMMQVMLSFRDELAREDFDAIPYINSEGYHSKTIAYSLWHIFRIEDIAAHTLIQGDEQVLFAKGYDERINSPLITTGNELVKQQIADFSKKLDIDQLYAYIADVRSSTEDIINGLAFDMLKVKIPDDRREALIKLNVVSSDESAVWLIDYWCRKDIRGSIQMPLSRHWIMHTEAALRIKEKLSQHGLRT